MEVQRFRRRKRAELLDERTAHSAELDDATQMYYYGARYYDPRISIFVSVDPLAEVTFEPYSYVGNNPIMFTDPTGMSKDDIVFMGEGGAEVHRIKND